MTSLELVEPARQALVLAVLLALPVIGSALAVSALTGVVQMLTGVQDATLGQVPRLVVTLLVFAATLPWILGQLTEFGGVIFDTIVAL